MPFNVVRAGGALVAAYAHTCVVTYIYVHTRVLHTCVVTYTLRTYMCIYIHIYVHT